MTVIVKKPKAAIKHLIENGPIERYKVGDASLSIRLKKEKNLYGHDEIFVDQIGDGRIIKLFDKTPFPMKSTDVICPHFLELKWANGCYYDCAWCYLNGTFRFFERGKNPHLKDEDSIISHIQAFFKQWNKPTILNSGELADSLVFEGHPFSLSKDIIPLFKSQNRHKLLILTKSTNVEGVLDSNSQNTVIASFSLNAYPVATRWEKKTPHPRDRIEAAKRLFDAGYEVRIRVDPMVPVEEWKEVYIELIDDVFSSFYPERITLGSLRGLRSTINNCEDTSWEEYLINGSNSNWGKKVEDGIRFDMYKTLLSHLMTVYDYNNVGLCKETVSMWENLKIDYKKIKCNCIL